MTVEAHLAALVQGKPADYVEIRVEQTGRTRLSYQGRKLHAITENEDVGGNVRARVGTGWGFVAFNRFDEIEARVEEAIAHASIMARHYPDGPYWAPVSPVVDQVLAMGDDPRQIPLARKKAVLDEYHQIVLGHGPEIRGSTIRYQDSFTRRTYVNSEGTRIVQEFVDVGLAVAAHAARGGMSQSTAFTCGGSSGFDVIAGWERDVAETAARACGLLDAAPAPGGEHTVVLDPMLAGVFVHEAFGHLSEADEQAESPDLRAVMRLGRRFGPDNLHIYDSGHVPGARGYMKYDDEGVLAEKAYLIRDGLLVGRLHSRESAARMGEKPTGNARAQDYRFRPICRMRCTALEPGEAALDDMLRGVRLGVYASGANGGETRGEMFTFTPGYARVIRDGELAEPVRDLTLTGNVFNTLAAIDMIGSDFAVKDSYGGCGKGDQWPLPTSEASPHIRIQNVVVGGGK